METLITIFVLAVDAPAQPQVDGTAPTFSKKPTIRQEDNGNTLVFHCAIVADPSPQITWYHNGVKVQDTDKYQVGPALFRWQFVKLLRMIRKHLGSKSFPFHQNIILSPGQATEPESQRERETET